MTDLTDLGQHQEQELHRDRIARVYLGQVSDEETQRKARDRIDWIVAQVSGPRVFDIGCSEGITSIKLAEQGLMVDAIDIHPEVISYARELADELLPPEAIRPNFSVTDIFKLDKIDPEYDSAILGEVLEHVYEPAHMLGRAILSLRDGGKLVATTPWGFFPAPDHHQTFYLSNFLEIVPPELTVDHVSVVDGYIRFVGTKKAESVQETALDHRAPANVPSVAEQLRLTEEAALAAQMHLRGLFDFQTTRLKESWALTEDWKRKFDLQRSKDAAEIEALKREVVALNGSLNETRADSDRFAGVHAAEIERLENSNEQLGNLLIEREKRIVQLEEELNGLHRELASSIAERQKNLQELNALEDVNSGLSLRGTMYLNEVKALKGQVEALHDAGEATSSEINELKGEVTALRDSVAALVAKKRSWRLRPAPRADLRNGPSRPAARGKPLRSLKRSLKQFARLSYSVGPFRAIAKRIIPVGLKKKIYRWVKNPSLARPSPPKVPVPRAPVAVSKSATAYHNEIGRFFERKHDFIVLCGNYPGSHGKYGGEFIRTRVEAYRKYGLSGCVVTVHKQYDDVLVDHEGTVSALRVNPKYEEEIFDGLKRSVGSVLVHSPSPEWQRILPQVVAPERLIYWYHGFEITDYRLFYFNYSTPELAKNRNKLDTVNAQRLAAGRQSFLDDRIAKVFVSEHFKRRASRFVGVDPLNSSVIHNYIDTDFYRKVDRPEASYRKLLLLRPFASRKYASDIGVKALEVLATTYPEFSKIDITVVGFGAGFEQGTAPLRSFDNIRIIEQYSTPEQMRQLFECHGVFLCPTRNDTQGVSFCEAMASGMTCITNGVAAIPDFASEDTAVLVPGDDFKAYAAAIKWVLAEPTRTREIGDRAAIRIREQCGAPRTILREIELIRNAYK